MKYFIESCNSVFSTSFDRLLSSYTHVFLPGRRRTERHRQPDDQPHPDVHQPAGKDGRGRAGGGGGGGRRGGGRRQRRGGQTDQGEHVEKRVRESECVLAFDWRPRKIVENKACALEYLVGFSGYLELD